MRETKAHGIRYHEGGLKAPESATGKRNSCTFACPGFTGGVVRQEEDDRVRIRSPVRGSCSNRVVTRYIVNYDGGILEHVDIYKLPVGIIGFMSKCTRTNEMRPG